MGILTKEQGVQIDKALKNIAVAKTEIVRAKSAGIDVSSQETQLLDAEKKLLAIKRVYFP